jgi:hypothetical protein
MPRIGKRYILQCSAGSGAIGERKRMNFNNGFYQTISAMFDLEKFSCVLTQALATIPQIQPVQTKDALGKWGVYSTKHEYCYGRHLYYKSATRGIIPFWLGLDITKNDTHIVITFEQNLINALDLKQHFAKLQAVHAQIQHHGNATYIEARLVPQDYTAFCSSENPQYLTDFINEVLSAL